MERKIEQQLIQWKNKTHDRKPLLLNGARQVGKTYILREFGSKEFKNVVSPVRSVLPIRMLYSHIQNNNREKLRSCSIPPAKQFFTYNVSGKRFNPASMIYFLSCRVRSLRESISAFNAMRSSSASSSAATSTSYSSP